MSAAGKRLIAAAKEASAKLRTEEIYQMFVYDLANELMNEAVRELRTSAATREVSRDFKRDLAAAMTAIAKAD